jgi:hypothetical protein
MVELIFNIGISTCYVGFIRGQVEISFLPWQRSCSFFFNWLEFCHTRQQICDFGYVGQKLVVEE